MRAPTLEPNRRHRAIVRDRRSNPKGSERHGNRDRDGPRATASRREVSSSGSERPTGFTADLEGGTNPRKEQRRTKLQNTARDRWTRRWNKPLKPAAALRKQPGGGEGTTVMGQRFEASRRGPENHRRPSALPTALRRSPRELRRRRERTVAEVVPALETSLSGRSLPETRSPARVTEGPGELDAEEV